MEKIRRENLQRQKTNIRHFRELEVYQLAMNSAMRIFEASKFFPPEKNILSPTRYDGLLAQFVQISLKRGASDDIPMLL